MIAIDTSAIIAILWEEAEALSFGKVIAEADRCVMSAVSVFEAAMVLISRGPAELAEPLDRLIERMSIEIVPFDAELARESRLAFVRFGRGRHPAALNFGDCVSYALARSRGMPLLFKGADFAKTDIVSAI